MSGIQQLLLVTSESTKTLTYIGNTTDAGIHDDYTFTNHAIGVASADRVVHVLIQSGGLNATTITSVTIQGITATINIQNNTSTQCAAIVSASVPTGTTGTIVVNTTANKDRCNIGVYASTGLTSTTAYDTDPSDADPATATLSTLADGFCLGLATNDENAATVSWTGLTGNYTANPGGDDTASGASAYTTGSDITPSGDFSASGTNRASVFATF